MGMSETLENPQTPENNPPAPKFEPFPKIPRLNRLVVVSEKKEGTL